MHAATMHLAPALGFRKAFLVQGYEPGAADYFECGRRTIGLIIELHWGQVQFVQVERGGDEYDLNWAKSALSVFLSCVMVTSRTTSPRQCRECGPSILSSCGRSSRVLLVGERWPTSSRAASQAHTGPIKKREEALGQGLCPPRPTPPPYRKCAGKYFVICTSTTSHHCSVKPFTVFSPGLRPRGVHGSIEQTTITIFINTHSLRRGLVDHSDRIVWRLGAAPGTEGVQPVKKAGRCKSRKLGTARRGRLRELRSVLMCSFLSCTWTIQHSM